MTAPVYIDALYAQAVGCLPPGDFDVINTEFPGAFDILASSWSRIFDGRLRKRYVTPFDPAPEILKYHVAQCVVFDLWRKRGFNPGSAQDGLIEKARTDALEWLREAADSKDGLIELPIRDDEDKDAVVKASPLAYTETSPYVWTDRQLENGSAEDESGFGH